MILFEKKSRANSCNIMDSPYLCIVFFIVLDLRLTRLGYSGIPFFLPLPEGLLVAALIDLIFIDSLPFENITVR